MKLEFGGGPAMWSLGDRYSGLFGDPEFPELFSDQFSDQYDDQMWSSRLLCGIVSRVFDTD